METTMMRLTFSVQGEFITQLAREQCHNEGKFEYAVELLMNCMMTDELSEREIRQMAIEILNGDAELHGVYPGDDYGFRYLDAKDESWNIEKTLQKLLEANKAYKEELEDLMCKYNFISENIQDYMFDRLNSKYRSLYDENLFSDIGTQEEEPLYSNILESYMKRQKCNSEDDFGWLEPNGTFHPVEWGDHQKWAYEWLKKNLSKEEFDGLKCRHRLYEAGDELMKKGWILLHNPSQGIEFTTKDETKRYTKAQQDFLYQYYTDRDCYKEANGIFEE